VRECVHQFNLKFVIGGIVRITFRVLEKLGQHIETITSTRGTKNHLVGVKEVNKADRKV